jgi:hypothetical protein
MKEYRSLEAISKTRNLTVEEKIRMEYLDEKQLEIYELAWNKIIDE